MRLRSVVMPSMAAGNSCPRRRPTTPTPPRSSAPHVDVIETFTAALLELNELWPPLFPARMDSRARASGMTRERMMEPLTPWPDAGGALVLRFLTLLRRHMLLALSSGVRGGVPSPGTGKPLSTNLVVATPPPRKRFRTKFTPEQKERMLQLSERLGWRLQKRDEGLVDECCRDRGGEGRLQGLDAQQQAPIVRVLGHPERSGRRRHHSLRLRRPRQRWRR
ncbi:hypothetical protein HPP92_002385, partial [Vanilla planifolia]